MAGELKRYDVSGQDMGGGRIAPAGTILKLADADAERLGLKKPTRKADDTSTAAPEAKPRGASTRKRPAPQG